jgi:hypothetical protein
MPQLEHVVRVVHVRAQGARRERGRERVGRLLARELLARPEQIDGCLPEEVSDLGLARVEVLDEEPADHGAAGGARGGDACGAQRHLGVDDTSSATGSVYAWMLPPVSVLTSWPALVSSLMPARLASR